MQIGSFGPIIFEVSGTGIKTFSELQQDSNGRWALHETINAPPITEFLGPGQDAVSLKIILSSALGAKPEKDFEDLRKLVRGGKNFPLIVNGQQLSGNKWYLETISSVTEYFEPGTGEALWKVVTCNFKEYR